MTVLNVKPKTPGCRFRIKPDFSSLTRCKCKKNVNNLLKTKNKTGGRNNTGRMTMRYNGGGHKKKLRIIDFKRNKNDVAGKIVGIEYDPYRSAFIALVSYSDGEKRYILAPEKLNVGDIVKSGKNIEPETGNAMELGDIPTGLFVYNIELNPGSGGKIVRSAGCYAQIVTKDKDFVSLKLPSGEVRLVSKKCRATIGVVSNHNHMNEMIGKAGRNRWIGVRPRVRGVAMNPVDHPMGGGEGKASGGHPRSRSGKMAKGLKTRKSGKYSDKMITSRMKA